MLDRLSRPARTRVITVVVGKWVRVVFFNRAEVSCLAIDAGPRDCFLIGDGEVIQTEAIAADRLRYLRFPPIPSLNWVKNYHRR